MSRRGSVSEAALMLFNDSIARCRRSGDLAGRFYDRFVAEPTIRAFFTGTNFEHQKTMLMASLYLVMSAAAGDEEGLRHLEHLADVHAQRGIPVETYALWLACLLETVAALDPEFSPEVAQAWRDVLHSGIEAMKRRALAGDPSKTA